MSERRRKFLFGAAILTILLGLLAAALLFLAGLEEEQCTLLGDKPQFDAIRLNSLASENYLALAKFLGYLKYEPGEVLGQKDPSKLYMPLRLEAIDYGVVTETGGEKQRLLSLSADCANIRLSFVNSSQPGRDETSVQAALVELPELEAPEITGAPEPKPDELACYLENLAAIKFSSKQHYGCYEPRSYPCKLIDSMGRERLVATLTVNYVAFELDGDPEAHKRAKYSKQMNYCPKG